MSVRFRWFAASLVMVVAMALSGCGDSASCSDDTDCPLGESCEGGLCVAPDQNDDENDQNANNDTNNDTNNDSNNDANQTDPPQNPEVVSISPDEDSTGVAVDTEIRVTYDQAISETYLTDSSVQLRNPSNQQVDTQFEYIEDDYEIVLTPEQDLHEGSRYVVRTTSDVRGTNGLLPGEEVDSAFITVWEPDEDEAELAEQYAPVVYQSTHGTEEPDVHLDIPTVVDFDGNLDAEDNLSNADSSSTDVPAHLYYSVKSTSTHHYLQYLLYYPGRFYGDPFESGTYEHDFLGIVVVVDRASGDVVFVDGVDGGESSSDDRRLSYKPDDSPVEALPENENPLVFDASELEDDRRFALYIPSGEHAPCYWYSRESASFWYNPCTGSDEQFTGSDGVVIYPGDSADTYSDAEEEDGQLEMSYELTPFYDPFWKRRGDYSCGLFTSPGYTYDPGSDRPVGPGDDPVLMSSSLCAEDSTAYGTLPYRWRGGNQLTPGVWLLDPAHFLTEYRYDFGDDVSGDYCYHPLFHIDERDDEDCQLEPEDDNGDNDNDD